MAITASVAALGALSFVASNLPKVNPPVPIYAVVQSDTLIPLTIPTSWLEFSARYETQISDYPQESGAFALYNKVRRPQQINVTMVKDGSDVARLAWLATIQQQESSNPTQLYTLISPNLIATDYTIMGLSYETRSDHGQNRLYLTINFMEVPQISDVLGLFSNVAEVVNGAVQQVGTLFTQTASAAQTAAANASSFILG